MTTVAYKDNLVILGGQDQQRDDNNYEARNDVLMYNTHSLECKRLPSMLEKRTACAAVIMGDVVVVMGGRLTKVNVNDYRYRRTVYLKTVEYYVIGDTTWRKLPDMNSTADNATACVYV